MKDTVWTVGHSTREAREFLRILEESAIELVVDVRRFPGSRRLPHFAQQSLEAHLQAHDIDYRWLPSLGGRRRSATSGAPKSGWRHPAFRAYADYALSEAFAEGLFELLVLARGKRVAIMCAEALWWRCHRRIIADVLVSLEIRVMHLMGAGATAEHAIGTPGRLDEGVLSYAPRDVT